MYKIIYFFFFKQKTAYEMRISDWSSDVCSSDLPGDDLVIGHRDHVGFRIERRADIAVFAVGREDLHAGTGRHLDARLLGEGLAVEPGDVILAAHGAPDLVAVRRDEVLMRRTADLGYVIHGFGRGLVQHNTVAADQDAGTRL